MMQPAATANPRARRTRTALIAAGLDLLAERPIDGIAIDQVVARAGVAKGSFFNHFADKQVFADAISREVRGEVEALVERINAGVTDPLERLAGGMIAAAHFARSQPRRAAILIRATSRMTPGHHPINRGLRADLDAAAAQGLIAADAAEEGVLYWLACCQAVMTRLVEAPESMTGTVTLLAAMLTLGLRGMGAPAAALCRLTDPAALAIRLTETNGVGEQRAG
ncbi:MAG: TetR/AcrR family transcriptional regulator [Proteobacteria bacterium]|nr:TetR/AcrR family transcriptional regulator [Pseudomonadota bacterium]